MSTCPEGGVIVNPFWRISWRGVVVGFAIILVAVVNCLLGRLVLRELAYEAQAAIHTLVVAFAYVPLHWWLTRQQPVPQPAPARAPVIETHVVETPATNVGSPAQATVSRKELKAMLKAPQYFIDYTENRLDDLLTVGILARRRKIKGKVGILFPQADLDLASLALETAFKIEAARQLTRNTWALPMGRVRRKGKKAECRSAEARRQARLAYLKLSNKRPAIEEQDILAQLPRLNQELDELLLSVTLITRRIDHLTARQAALQEVLAVRGTPRWIVEEFDRLCAQPYFADLRIDLPNSVFLMQTSMLYGEEVDVNGVTRYYRVGAFDMSINPHGGIDSIRLRNRTHRRGTWDAPHVESGHPDCFGRMLQNALAIHLGRQEYSVIFTMLVQYLTRDTRGGFARGGWEEVPVEIARPHLVKRAGP
ncbi:MAG: hypothetical protein HYZ09_01120 [Candidatus Kerfeldbacteria bacterium]|nr:hypothetical protein [Candidatus Kerfeldbacteria bacterium]